MPSDTYKLQLYNDALLIAGERALASLSEDREPRYLLDQVYASKDGIEACLEEGQWEFAMRTVRIDYDPSIAPEYGYNRAFQKPSDWVLTSSVCSDEFMRAPLLRYVDEAGYWYSELDSIYVRYVSDDPSYGMNLGGWPPSFWQFVATHFASRIILKLSNDETRMRMILNPENPDAGLRAKALRHARGRCAMAGPTTIMAQGQWSRSRTRGVNRRDGGPISGNLTTG